MFEDKNYNQTFTWITELYEYDSCSLFQKFLYDLPIGVRGDG